MKKSNCLKIVKREFQDFRHFKSWWVYVLYFLMMISNGLIPFVSITLSRIIIDDIIDGVSFEIICKTIIIICVIGIILFVIKQLTENIIFLFAVDLRLQEFDKINKKFLNIDYYHLEDSSFRDQFEVSITALNGDDLGYEKVLILVRDTLPLIFSFIIYSVIIGMFNVFVLLGCIGSGIFIAVVNYFIGNYVASKKEVLVHASRQKSYFNRLTYDFSYGKDIRIYCLKDKLINDLMKKSNNYLNINNDIESKRFLYGLIEIVFLLLADGLCYYFVIVNYFKNNLTLGEVSMYISLITSLSLTMRNITNNVGRLVRETKYVESYYEMLDLLDNYYTTGHLKAFPENENIEIEFKNVSFKYPHTERYILKNFNFVIHKGEKLAIVGVNGAGKSTIVKLISGLFYPDEGSILLNGKDIKEFDKEELAKMFSVVYQDINIFAATIMENITGANPNDVEIKRAKEALAAVGLKEKIESLPKQYDTELLKVIYDDGIELSGGQNQKLAIARALYKNGNIVILDEPTAALDALAEQEIYTSFNLLVKNKTSIFISHRLASTRFCDKIALFSRHGLIEYGTHEELMNLKKEYYHMFMVQGKYYQEAKDE